MGSRKYNYQYNLSRSSKNLACKMINGQALGEAAQLRFGLCRMSFNGCEVISVYNALQYLGIPRPLWEIAAFMERYRILFGFFGCNVYRLGKVLSRYGAAFERLKKPGDHPAFIVSYWTGRRFLSQIHTVFCVRTAEGILVYNRYNRCPTAQLCRSFDELTKGRHPIAVYSVSAV